MNDNGGPEHDAALPLEPVNPADPVPSAAPVHPVNSGGPGSPADPMTPRVPVVREKPMRTWLWPTLLIFGLVIGVALVVMVLVSSADFSDQPARVTPTPGSCHPFCTETGAPPAP